MAGKDFRGRIGSGLCQEWVIFMTTFYDPTTRKPHPWVLIVFIILPILISLLSFVFGQKSFQDKVEREKRAAQSDVYDKF